MRPSAATAAIASSTDPAREPVDAVAHDLGHAAARERDDRRPAGARLGHDDAERLFPVDRHQQGRGLAEQPVSSGHRRPARRSARGRRRRAERSAHRSSAASGPSSTRLPAMTSRRSAPRAIAIASCAPLIGIEPAEKHERRIGRHRHARRVRGDVHAVEDRPPFAADRRIERPMPVDARGTAGEHERGPGQPDGAGHARPRHAVALIALDLRQPAPRQNRQQRRQPAEAVDDVDVPALPPERACHLHEFPGADAIAGVRRLAVRHQTGRRAAVGVRDERHLVAPRSSSRTSTSITRSMPP